MKTVNSVIILLLITAHIIAQNNIDSTEGVWEQEGYGRIIEIKNKKAIIYDICNTSCNKNTVATSKILIKKYNISSTSKNTLIAQNGVSKYFFNRIDKLPNLCVIKVQNKKDPIYNFEALWQTFNEHYVYFNERKIDWNALKTKYKSRINKNTTDFDLYIILREMIKELNDGHSFIIPPKKVMKKYLHYKSENRKKRKKKILDSLGQDYKLPSIHVDSLRLIIIKNYVKDIKTYNFGVLNYGLINKDVALVQINGMEQFANYNIPSTISEGKAEKRYEKNAQKSENYTKDEANGASYIMDKVISEIKNTKICIIDIRFNGGGFDEVQLEMLKRFATKETLVINKKARNNNGFTQKQSFFVKPTKNAYKGRVYVLTSYQTASAAEDFALGTMSAIPNAIRIGSNTTGIFSDILDKKLPNGWQYGLSNEIYQSPEGKSYEVIGIEPHYKIDYPKKGYWFYKQLYDDKTGKDEAIEKVFELEKMNP
ncbi:MAG: S41 family peptidase [Flavobacteriaceae bacterium]|nr:S41 family peptidase [Flavobacteriaceae bacterium]